MRHNKKTKTKQKKKQTHKKAVTRKRSKQIIVKTLLVCRDLFVRGRGRTWKDEGGRETT